MSQPLNTPDWESAYKDLVRQLADPPDGWSTFGTHIDPATGKALDVELEFWGDDGGVPIWERPVPRAPGEAARLAESMRVYWETKDYTASQFRAALTEARLRQR